MDKNKPQRYAVSMVWPNGIKTVNLFHHEANARQYVGQMLVMYKQNQVYLGEIQQATTETDDD